MEIKTLSESITLMKTAHKLESTFRFSETLRGVKQSVAEHSWRLAFLCLLVHEELKLEIDIGHALKLALMHDVVESVTGEVDAWRVIQGEICPVVKEQKEKEALEFLTKDMAVGHTLRNLFQEYVDQSSEEARFVKGLDKIDGFLTILEAGHKKYTKEVFYASYADEAVQKFPQLEGLLTQVKTMLKEELLKGNVQWIE